MPTTNLRATFSAIDEAARRAGSATTSSIMAPNPEPEPEPEPEPVIEQVPEPSPVIEESDSSASSNVVNRTFRSKNPNHTRTFGWVDPTELEIDPTIQRPENKVLINGIAREYDPYAAGVITVSIREWVDPETGEKRETLVVVDGQQRTRAAIRAGYTEKVPAMLHRGLSRPEEAELFRRLNFRRSVTAINLFRSAIVEGDQDVLNIVATLDELDIPFSSSKGFTAVRVARRLAKRKNGIANFRWALVTIGAIYDTDGRGGVYDGRVVEAFARFYERFRDDIDEKELRSKLLKNPGGIAGLIGHAETIRAGAGGSMFPNLCQALIVRYNFNKQKKNYLPDWKASRDEVEESGDTDN